MQQNTETLESRAQSIAHLTIAVVKMNSNPAEVTPLVQAVERILEIAADAPGGWSSLIDGLKSCHSRSDVAAFCRAFTSTLTVEAASDGPSASFDPQHQL